MMYTQWFGQIWVRLFLLSNLHPFTMLNCLKPHLVLHAAQMSADENGAILESGGINFQYAVCYNAASQENTAGQAAILLKALNSDTVLRPLAKN